MPSDLEDELDDAPRQAASRKPDPQEFGDFLEDDEEDEFGDFIEDDLGGGAEGGAGVQPGRRRRRMTGMPAGVSAAAMRVRTSKSGMELRKWQQAVPINDSFQGMIMEWWSGIYWRRSRN